MTVRVHGVSTRPPQVVPSAALMLILAASAGAQVPLGEAAARLELRPVRTSPEVEKAP
jgi:hypothetical protein